MARQESLSVGRMPSCDVVMDSKRFPQMISRTHARLETRPGAQEPRWRVFRSISMEIPRKISRNLEESREISMDLAAI